MPDNIGEMFYYGETPWHKKGRKIPTPANAADALKLGGLDWQVEMKPLETVEDPPSPVRRRMAVVRTDREPGDSRRVLGVVHPGFRPLQNRKGIELFDALIGHGKAIYHTGGYLGNGEIVWLLARLPENIKSAAMMLSNRTCSLPIAMLVRLRLIFALPPSASFAKIH